MLLSSESFSGLRSPPARTICARCLPGPRQVNSANFGTRIFKNPACVAFGWKVVRRHNRIHVPRNIMLPLNTFLAVLAPVNSLLATAKLGGRLYPG